MSVGLRAGEINANPLGGGGMAMEGVPGVMAIWRGVLGAIVPEVGAVSPLNVRFTPLFGVGAIYVADTKGEAATACAIVDAPCAAEDFPFAWTPNLGDELGVDSVPEPLPRFINDAGVTGARADFGVLEADEAVLLAIEESLLSDGGADTGVYIFPTCIPFSAIGNNAGDD